MNIMVQRRAHARPARNTPDRQWLWKLVLSEAVIRPAVRWLLANGRHWLDQIYR